MLSLRVLINLIGYLKFTMLSTQILVQYYTWPHYDFIVLLNLMFTMLSIKN